jgi:hypothetical protein
MPASIPFSTLVTIDVVMNLRGKIRLAKKEMASAHFPPDLMRLPLKTDELKSRYG